MQTITAAKKIIASSGVKNPEILLVKHTQQISTSERTVSQFEKGSYVILDFGKELCGGIRILVSRPGGEDVRIRFGESVTECCSEIGEKNSTNDHAIRDLTLKLPVLSDTFFGETGFRFVRLDFMGATSVKSVVAVSKIFRHKAIYTYAGADKRIAQIYEVAKRTVDLCSWGEYVWDGVKRDKLVWIGDLYPEILALTTLYGRLDKIEKSLDFVKRQAPLPKWMNLCYPTYSMWWVIILCDYRYSTGADFYAKKQMPYLKKLISQMNDCVSDDGTMNYERFFIDWPTTDKPDEEAGARALNITMCKKAIDLLLFFGESTVTVMRLLTKLLKKPIEVKESKQVMALKYFAVGLTKEEQDMLVEGGAKGMSTFMSYPILCAIASFDKDKAITIMKEYFGAMLDKGATTFWEDFNIEWAKGSGRIDRFPKEGEKDVHGDFGGYCYEGFRHSLCHGWSSGVIKFIKDFCDSAQQ